MVNKTASRNSFNHNAGQIDSSSSKAAGRGGVNKLAPLPEPRALESQRTVTGGKFSLTCTEADWHPKMDRVVGEIERKINEANDKLPDDLKLPRERIGQINNALWEILPNAFEHGRKRKPDGTIKETAKIFVQYEIIVEPFSKMNPFLLSVSVRDKGDGLSQERLDEIIRRFEPINEPVEGCIGGSRVFSLVERGRGLQIVLSYANNTVIQNAEGGGTRVEVYFIREAPEQGDQKLAIRASALSLSSSDFFDKFMAMVA